MILFANAEPPNWFGVAFLLTSAVWLAVHLVLTLVAGILVYKVFRLIWKIELRAQEAAEDRKDAAEDRKLTHELLMIVKGWALVVERKEIAKDRKLQQVAETAEKTAVQITQAVEATVEATANKVVAVLDQRAGGESAIIKGQ